jgi:hypothetical protein
MPNSKVVCALSLILAAASIRSQAVAAPAIKSAARRVQLTAQVAAKPGTNSEEWTAGYAAARAEMLAGHFQAAAAAFESLTVSAQDLANRALATEMMSACRTWAQGGFVLTTQDKMDLAKPRLLEDRRTTDEIAILYSNAVLYGLYTGIMVDTWNKPGSAGGVILPPLALAGASAGIVALVDHSLHLGYGVAQSIVAGMYVGYEEGIAWILWHEANTSGSSKFGARSANTLIWGMGTLGAVVGGVVGSIYGTTPGRASLMGSAAMWSGAIAGSMAGAITEHADSALLSAAIALNVGVVAGALAGAEVSPSIARVRFVDLGGLSGGLLVGGLYWSIQDKGASGRGLLTATGLGMATGLTTAWLLTRNMETDQRRKGREPSFAERLVPTLTPTSTGTGLMVGVGAVL